TMSRRPDRTAPSAGSYRGYRVLPAGNPNKTPSTKCRRVDLPASLGPYTTVSPSPIPVWAVSANAPNASILQPLMRIVSPTLPTCRTPGQCSSVNAVNAVVRASSNNSGSSGSGAWAPSQSRYSTPRPGTQSVRGPDPE